MECVYHFSKVSGDLFKLAGGKGASLSKMYQNKIPVPEGFVILSTAFLDNNLKDDATLSIKQHLDMLPDVKLCVRSSALSEDSVKTSFAGEFETVLDVSKEDVIEAVKRVSASAKSLRVAEYSKAHGIDENHSIAVVVQVLIKAKMSGVLFSVDPITGSHVNMIGNYVYGAGESLVSGENNAYEFKISRVNGKYEGNGIFKYYAKTMYNMTKRIENIFNLKQDIEWVIDDDKNLFIVQARPITTLETINYDTYEINQSLDTDALWTSNNVMEAIPDVMSPFTWSILHEMDLECQKIPGYLMFGNICGRCYTNISIIYSAMAKVGFNVKNTEALMSDVFGYIPKGLTVPIYPFKFLPLIKDVTSRAKRTLRIRKESKEQKSHYLEYTSIWYAKTMKAIKETNSRDEILKLWQNLRPFLSSLWYIWFGGAGSTTLNSLRKRLVTMVGEEQANLLCSNFSKSNTLASMEPLLGIEEIIEGKLSRERYAELYGHRSPHEFEVYYEYPGDDINYIDKQIEEFKSSNISPRKLIESQKQEFKRAKDMFIKKFPNKKEWLEKKLDTISNDANTRESLRSEFLKIFRAMRHLLIKIGQVTEIFDDIFMVYCFEIPKLLQGDESMVKNLKDRRQNFEKYRKYPIFPQYIRGRFNPDEWINLKDRRQDYYDPNVNSKILDENVIKGFAGAPGVVEGVVRILSSFDESDKFQTGEILVTSLTNVGWTPMFPKAGAIITDIGAPLSHAAIVARELGIPAVVGCGNGTTMLKTGDKVIVNGSLGIVTKI